jgi:hypothetical protein
MGLYERWLGLSLSWALALDVVIELEKDTEEDLTGILRPHTWSVKDVIGGHGGQASFIRLARVGAFRQRPRLALPDSDWEYPPLAPALEGRPGL